MKNKRNQVKGLTTAAGMWATAAIGVAIGCGFYLGAFVATFACIVTAAYLTRLERQRKRKVSVHIYAEANNIENLTSLMNPNVCGIMFEIVQGEGGVIPLTKEFVQGVAELCKKEDILLICDEAQVGNGRSGMLYGYMNYGIQPDIFSTAKTQNNLLKII